MLEQIACTRADVVISSGHLVRKFPFLRELPVPWVADVYIPGAVESLAWHACSEPDQRIGAYKHAWNVARDAARHADWLICASERQRDFWLGALAAQGRLCPELYAQDPELRNLIDVVPFGCPASRPEPAAVLKGVRPGIGPRDRLILWGGGVWNWFDPITLLRAMPYVLECHPESRLVFLGANHPDPARVPEMERARQARSLSQELGLEDRFVFWGDWVPYANRGAYLLEADVGVSLHPEGAEARLAFRTRLLDAIWAGLPMVLTRGDILAERFEQRGLGQVVDAGAVEQAAKAINMLLAEPNARASRQAAFGRLRNEFSWERVSEPLLGFCKAPAMGPGKREALALLEAKVAKERMIHRAEVARLQKLVHGYESGRFMQMMAAVHKLRRRLPGRSRD
jgi:glycosyltransferase involved in cell wall biosynthesis